MTANKTDAGTVALSSTQPTHKHPLTIKTSFNDNTEPVDSNSMGPAPAATSVPGSIWYVTPPAPSHPNISTRRHSAVSFTSAAAFSPSTPSAVMTDVPLESENAVAPSPTEPSMASAVSSLFTPTSSTAGRKNATSATLLPSNATTEVEFVLESPLEIEMQRFCNGFKTPEDSIDISVIPKQNNQYGCQRLQPQNGQQEQQQVQTQSNSFFSGFFAVPPSLAGRPKLTEEQEEYMHRQFQCGPVPLMWPKEDLENQNQNQNKSQSEEQQATQSTGSGWFANWWTSPSTDKSAVTRREGAMAQ
ncbi:hypothetical protein BGZ58_000753 [Dissophora ornata]|nr:hypothetical protein BGZ58_000753 [Dissophora ornata]